MYPAEARGGTGRGREKSGSRIKLMSKSRETIEAPRIAVVGAGPAGATAARLLAAWGARVVLLEAHRLPRRKLCGGGLTPKAQRLVPPSALATVERRVHRVELRGGWLPGLALDEPAAEIAMVERDRFDAALVDAAAAVGADVRDGERVLAITEDADGVTLTTASGRLRVDVVVAADGDPSGLARRLGLGGAPSRRSLALEIDLPLSERLATDTAVLAFAIAGGYAWYFPKGDHANVGAGTYHVAGGPGAVDRPLRQVLSRFAASVGLNAAEGKVAGHWIAQGLRRGPLASPRVVLAGDAAATADPLFGEGISYAIVSGLAAAQAVTDWDGGRIPDLRGYDARLRTLLGPAMRRLTLAADVAEPSLTLAMAAIRLSPWVRATAVDAIAGRGLPFAIDTDCRLACPCGIAHDPLVAHVCAEPCPHAARAVSTTRDCRTPGELEAASPFPCELPSPSSDPGRLRWAA